MTQRSGLECFHVRSSFRGEYFLARTLSNRAAKVLRRGGANVETLKPDLCVIGAGAAGLAAAGGAAALNVPVVLIEQGRFGGDHLNYACLPSKALIAAARRTAQIGAAPGFGVTAGPVTVDFAKVREHIRAVVAARAANDARERYIGLGVRMVAGSAIFTDRATVAGGDATEIKAKHFVIATGSVPSVPPISGLKDAPFLTNETIFDLDHCPEHLVVIGAGATGLELAQAFRRLGARVTVLEAERPLGDDDAECVQAVLDQFARERIIVRSGVEVLRVSCMSPGRCRSPSRRPMVPKPLQRVTRWWRQAVRPIGPSSLPRRASNTTLAALLSTSRCAQAIAGFLPLATLPAAVFTHEAVHQAHVVIKNLFLRQSAETEHDPVNGQCRISLQQSQYGSPAADFDVVAVGADAQDAPQPFRVIDRQLEHDCGLALAPDFPGRLALTMHAVIGDLVLEGVHGLPEALIAIGEELALGDQSLERSFDKFVLALNVVEY